MIRGIHIIILTMLSHFTVQSQAIYVDSKTGDDNNPGTIESPVYSIKKAIELFRNGDICTIRINPGMYVLDSHVSVSAGKTITDKKVLIEAGILPDNPSWTPEKMPVIANVSQKGEIPVNENFVVSFLVEESHVTIRGLKFQGYSYPHARYFPIARLDKTRTDLLIKQCMFVGDANISQIQAGVIASGNGVRIDHCIFYKPRNTVVFFLDSGDGMKSGNGMTNSIIYGASQAIWTASQDKDFEFANNIVSDCRYVWAKNDFNKTIYSIHNCLIVNNKYYTGLADKERLSPKKFEMNETGVIKTGKVTLNLTGVDDAPFLDEVDKPLPIDFMHPLTGSPGYDMMAGLFSVRK